MPRGRIGRAGWDDAAGNSVKRRGDARDDIHPAPTAILRRVQIYQRSANFQTIGVALIFHFLIFT